jgi:hypothetical protein
MPRRRGTVLLWVGGVLLVLDLGGALLAALWALFFSAGLRGQSTEDAVRYNLSDPFTATLAYGPLVIAIVVGVSALVCILIGVVRYRRAA